MILKCGNREFIFGHKTYVMGVINVTPDSFSDGGRFKTLNSVISCAEQMLEDEVDVIDVGGESTRPFSNEVNLEEELRRVLKVISSLATRGITNISIDTRKAEVARQCLSEGASWINDVSAFSDVKMLEVASKADALVIVHSRGSPDVMQKNKIIYDDVVSEVGDFLRKKVNFASEYNISKKKILVDQGIGFGKTLKHNLQLSRQLKKFKNIGAGVLYGPSRKAFLGEISNIKKPAERDAATLGAIAFACMNNTDMVRVHDVKGTVKMLKVLQKLKE